MIDRFKLILVAGLSAVAAAGAVAASQEPEGPRGPTGKGAQTSKTAGGCVGRVSAGGYHATRGLALGNAQSNWESIVANNYGILYEKWSNSVNRTEECRRGSGMFGQWACNISAEPCQPGGTSTGTGTGTPACYPSLSVTGAEALVQQPSAEANARNKWQHDAGNAYGVAYKAWNTAQDKTMFCNHNGKKVPFRRWSCTATGKPCK